MAQLTELKIKAIKPSEKMARYYDGGGLYLERVWKLIYQ